MKPTYRPDKWLGTTLPKASTSVVSQKMALCQVVGSELVLQKSCVWFEFREPCQEAVVLGQMFQKGAATAIAISDVWNLRSTKKRTMCIVLIPAQAQWR